MGITLKLWRRRALSVDDTTDNLRAVATSAWFDPERRASAYPTKRKPMITALIATHETTQEEKDRAEIVVSKHGALTKNRRGIIAPDNNLWCNLTKMTVTDEEVNLHFPESECCDMQAAIKLAICAAPTVIRIQTWSGEKRDTGYMKEGGDWKSLLAN